MRIHEIEILNIASLKGQHKIDFDQVNNYSSLFAITGKTGAGKSSILNSISLALYNDVYKRDSQSNDFVTLGEAQGEIKLIFSTNNQVYMAFWQMKLKKKNGEYLKKPQLVRTLSQKIENKYVVIEKNIEQIINLNFDQFCKTSILNQGEFARFLTSKFTERKSILEKFYDGMDLELINLKLRHKIKENKEELEEKNNRIKGIEQAISEIEITEKEVKALEKEVQELKSIFKTLELTHPKVTDIYKQYVVIGDNEYRKKDLQAKQEVSQKQYNVLKKENDRLSKEHSQNKANLETRKPILDQCIKKLIELKKNTEQKESYTNQKSSYIKEKEEAEQSLKHTITEISKQQETQNLLLESNSNISSIKLEKIITNLEQLKSLFENIKSLDTRIISNQSKIDTQVIKINDSQEKMSDISKTLKSFELEKYESATKKTESKVIELTKLKDLIKNNDKELQTLNQELKKNTEDIEKANLKQTNETKENKHIEENIRLYENTQSLYSLQNAIHLCLESSLESGKCVVCHNEIDTKEIGNKKLDDSELEQANNKLEVLRQEQDVLRNKQEQTKVQLLSLKSEQNRLKEAAGNLSSVCLIEWNKHSELPLIQNVLKASSLDPIEKLINSFKDQIEKLREDKKVHELDQQKIGHLQDQAKQFQAHLEDVNNELKNLNNEKSLAQKTFKQILTDYSIDPIEEPVVAIEKVADLLALVTKYNKSLEKSTELVKEKSRLTEAQFNSAKKIEDLSLKIKEVIKQNTELKDYIDTNTKDDLSAEQELRAIEEDFDLSGKLLTKNKDDLGQEKVFLAESKSKLENSEEQIKAAALMIKNHQKMIDDIMDPARKAYFLNKDLFNPLPALLDKFVKFDSADLELEKVIELSLEKFNDLFGRSKVLYRQKDKDLTEAKTLFKQKSDGLAQIEEIHQRSTVLIEQKEKLNNLNELIGKDEFRNYILSIIETTLIEQTNKELNTLCSGRYSLCQSNKTNRLITEFKIIDHYADSMIRKISTLSGGETFLVSLAMALALAELTRGQTQLDSLFIDEGFGTLDSETIDDVYELLLTIQHSGKQIGIISHVKELTNRIPVNINLEKNTAGMSNIQIINN